MRTLFRPGRHARPAATGRRTTTALVGAAVLVGAALTAALPAAAAVGDPCSGNWAPVIRSVTVTQGVGNTSVLTRGKATIVRPFLTAPLCAPVGSEQLISASVTAYDGSTAIGSATTPTGFGPTYPTLDAYSLGAGNGSPSSPILRVAALGANAPTAGVFTASIASTVTYQYQAIVGGPLTTATTPLGQIATASVSPKANPLRILVVPLGDASQPISSQFPKASNGGTPTGSSNAYADTAVQNGMATLSRLLPLADGVGDLTASTGGLRYRLDDAGVIDIGPNGLKLMSTDAATGARYFCGSAGKFVQPSGGPSLSSQLAAYLTNWNKANATAQADRVLGVVWQGISRGTADGCDEGYAIAGGRQAYSRIVVDSTVTSSGSSVPNPALTGSLMGMEVGHTLGAVPLTDPRDTYRDYHSSNKSADPAGVAQNYDTTLAKWMSAPLSDFQYSGSTSGYTKPSSGTASPWNDRTVLLEQPDFSYEQCQLTPGLPAAGCQYGAVAGSVGAAAAGAALSLAGTTDGTASGTDIHSYYADPVEQTAPAPPPASGPDYRLIQRDGNGNRISTCSTSGCLDLGDQRVAVQAAATDHGGGALLTTLQFGSVTGSFPVAPGSAAFELWKGEPPAGSPSCLPGALPPDCIYARLAGTAPEITTTSGTTALSGLGDFTNVTGDETKPALSADGGLLAWVKGGAIFVQRRDPSTNLPIGAKSLGIAGTDPAWSKTGTTLAYATAAGDIDTVAVTAGTGTAAPTAGPATRVYDHLIQTPPALGSTAAAHPSFSPDATYLALQINGGIWRVNATGTTTNPVVCDLATLNVTNTCRPLATDGNDSAPAWGTSAGTNRGGLIAYNRGSDLWTLDPNASSIAPVLRVSAAQLPSWSGDLVSYVAGGNVWVADSSRVASTGLWTTRTQLTTGGNDTAGALASNAGAIAFDRLTVSNGHDVFDATVGSGNSTLDFSARTKGDPALVRADLYALCASAYDPIAAALRPVSTTTGSPYSSASFSFTYDDARACPGGTLYAQVTNGYLSSQLIAVRTIPGTSAPIIPSPAIGTPAPGSIWLQYDVIPATGSNADPSGGTNNAGYSSQWLLTGPTGSGYSETPVGTGSRVDIAPPASGGGWKPGGYTLTQKVTNSAGQTAAASTSYTVLADPGHIGASSPTKFTPTTLYVPSNGNDVTIVVSPQPGQDLSKIDQSTVRIVEVGNTSTAIPIDTASGTSGWAPNGNGSYTAKFNRTTLTCAMSATGLVPGYIPVTVSGSGPGVAFRGLDPASPTTSPATPQPPC